jgi:leucyl aminopeptidase (aminopeptidase T)
MLQNYVSPDHKIVDLIEALHYPFARLPAGSNVLIVTDTNMDSAIWQAMMGLIRQRGADPVLALYTPRAHHTAEPPPAATAALEGADYCVLLTTTSLAQSEFWEKTVELKVGTLLMEEATTEILTSAGCRLTDDDIEQISERSKRVRQIWMQGGEVRVTTPAGTDLRAQLEPGPKRNADPAPAILSLLNGRRTGGTWPYGENRVTPLEGSGNGRVVWDICAHWPPGRFSQPVVLEIEAGRVTKIDGGAEAREVRHYLDTHGDENITNAPAEISVGTNHRASVMGLVRNDKKALGTAHIAIGRSDIGGTVVSSIHFDGLMSQPTITVNGRTFMRDGVLDEDL